jgi:hypothetical protein
MLVKLKLKDFFNQVFARVYYLYIPKVFPAMLHLHSEAGGEEGLTRHKKQI